VKGSSARAARDDASGKVSAMKTIFMYTRRTVEPRAADR
jgi:hypothetical protein